jgi:hypothetical protein
MIDRLKDNLDDFPDLVAFIEGIEFFQKEAISKLKAKVRLFDGSILLNLPRKPIYMQSFHLSKIFSNDQFLFQIQ